MAERFSNPLKSFEIFYGPIKASEAKRVCLKLNLVCRWTFQIMLPNILGFDVTALDRSETQIWLFLDQLLN